MTANNLVDDRGNPTSAGVRKLSAVTDMLLAWRVGYHNDNTGLPCRKDLSGHDCCDVCNTAESVLRHVDVPGGVDL